MREADIGENRHPLFADLLECVLKNEQCGLNNTNPA